MKHTFLLSHSHLKHALIYATGHLLSADIKMIKLKDVTDDKCWPFNLPQFTASSIFILDHWGLKCCINGRGAVQHYESTGQYIQVFFLSIIPPAVVGKEHNVSLFGPLLFEQRDVKECTCWTACPVRLKLRFFISLSYCFSSLAEGASQFGQKAYLECSHFE